MKFIKTFTKLSAPLILGSISASLLFSPSVQAGYFDCFDDLHLNSVEITDSSIGRASYMSGNLKPETTMMFYGEVKNKRSSETIRQIFIDVLIQECHSMGGNCAVIDRQAIKLLGSGDISKVGIPPYQARRFSREFFDITGSPSFVATQGKVIRYSYSIKNICAYSYLEELLDD